MKKLTDKQSEMLRFIKDFMIQNGYCPSTRDIMYGVGYKSTSNVNMMLHALEDKGYIEMPIKGGSRAIKVVGLVIVEGITCKDCKYYREDDDTGYCTNHTCGDIVFWCRDDYYCADAMRKDVANE